MEELSSLLSIIGLEAHHAPLVALPLIGALIGWFTNYLAVKMLFHPKHPVPLGLFTLHGVFPKRQRALAEKLGRVVSTELFSVDEVTAHIEQRAQSDEVIGLIGDHIEVILRQKLPQVVPMVALVLNDELIETVKTAFIDELRIFISQVTEKLTSSVREDLDVHKIVEEKVLGFSSDKLEEILFAIMKREFRFIELIGAVLGFLIGVGQMWYLVIAGVS
jgi:uncharacterized membrane protein YheB (UPF0754 family)